MSNYDFLPTVLNQLGLGDKLPRQPVLPGGAEAEKAGGGRDLLDEQHPGQRPDEGPAAAEDARGDGTAADAHEARVRKVPRVIVRKWEDG